MNITEWRLNIIHTVGDQETGTLELIYRGNENVLINSDNVTDDNGKYSIRIPRHILQKFMDIIE